MAGSDEHTERIRKQFTRQAQAYADTDQARDLRGMAKLVQLTAADHTSVVLDVACGPGRLTMAAARQAKSAVGLDATDALLEIARAEAAGLGLENIRFEQGDAAAIPFDDETFDLVCCRAAFHHFQEPVRILCEMARVARRGGQVLIADILGHDDAEVAARHDAIEQLCDPTHVRCIPASEFDRLIEASGLQESQRIHNAMSYDVDGWIDHGGPAHDVADRIRNTFQENLADDKTGLNVRQEDGVLKFTHQTAVLLLTKP